VPQRRRRVFILGIHARVDTSGQRAAEVLSVGSRCGGHPPASIDSGSITPDSPEDGPELRGYRSTNSFGAWEFDPLAGTVSRRDWKSANELVVGTLTGPSPHGGWPGQDQAVEGHVIPTLRAPSDTGRDGAPDGLAGRVDDSLLPRTLDAPRYKCCGNGVVSSVTEWIGSRLLAATP
jgi:hypothetical protein